MFSDLILRTPLIPFRISDPAIAGRIFMKAENLQPFGSYKIRGVKSAIESTRPEILKHGLVTVSAGNMAQAVAYAAKMINVPCRVYVPDTAPAVKKAAIENIGAELIERPFDEIWNMVCLGLPTEKGLVIHPTRTPGITEGYGAIADEILLEQPDTDAVVIPFGVGGLSLGISRRLKILKPEVVIYPCEPETAAPLSASLKLGRATSVQRVPSFVDAIGTPEVLPEVFETLSAYIKTSIVMELKDIKHAMDTLVLQHKLVCEGAAATALAAAIHLARNSSYQRITCILSGGNIAPEILQQSISPPACQLRSHDFSVVQNTASQAIHF